jgi:hypothetical protein
MANAARSMSASRHSRRFDISAAYPYLAVSDLQFGVAYSKKGVVQAPEPAPRIHEILNSQTLSGLPLGRSFQTSRAADRESTTGRSLTVLLDIAVRRTMARPVGELWALHDLLQSVRSLANGWHLGRDHGGPSETHDGSVQMIDTSFVHVHQHGGCVGGGQSKADGSFERWANDQNTRSVDTNGKPVRH